MNQSCDNCEHSDLTTETCGYWNGELPEKRLCSEYKEREKNRVRIDAYDIQRILKGEEIEVIRNGNIIVISADLQDTKGMKLVCAEQLN